MYGHALVSTHGKLFSLQPRANWTELHGTSWYKLVQTGTSWCKLVQAGASWCKLDGADAISTVL